MKKAHITPALLCAASVALLAATALRAQEGKKAKPPKGGAVKMEDLPGAVVAAVNAEEPGLTPDKISKTQGRAKDGQEPKVAYNISGTVGGSQVQMSVLNDGTITRKVTQLPADNLPPLVSSGANNAARSAAAPRLPYTHPAPAPRP